MIFLDFLEMIARFQLIILTKFVDFLPVSAIVDRSGIVVHSQQRISM